VPPLSSSLPLGVSDPVLPRVPLEALLGSPGCPLEGIARVELLPPRRRPAARPSLGQIFGLPPVSGGFREALPP